MKKILISSCLLGQKVRYDAKHSFVEDPLIRLWHSLNMIVSLCPEVAAGLPIPRAAVEIIAQDSPKLTDKIGNDYTNQFILGAHLALEKTREMNIKCAILKSKSPSCGRGKIYDGNFNQQLIDGDGITARLLQDNGIRVFNETELSQANDFLESL